MCQPAMSEFPRKRPRLRQPQRYGVLRGDRKRPTQTTPRRVCSARPGTGTTRALDPRGGFRHSGSGTDDDRHLLLRLLLPNPVFPAPWRCANVTVDDTTAA